MYAGMVRDILQWHGKQAVNWQKSSELVTEKYREDRKYYMSCLDVKLEGAFVLMGLLCGNDHLDKSMVIGLRCGFDCECKLSSAGGVLLMTVGMSKLPDQYYKGRDQTRVVSYTAYRFFALIAVGDKLAQQASSERAGVWKRDAARRSLLCR